MVIAKWRGREHYLPDLGLRPGARIQIWSCITGSHLHILPNQ